MRMNSPKVFIGRLSDEYEDEYSGTTISPLEEARIREEVCTMMKQQFAEARAKLKSIQLCMEIVRNLVMRLLILM